MESVYQEALAREFTEAGIPFKREEKLRIFYKGVPLEKEFIADFVCYDKIIVELKALAKITNVHKCQVKNYLKATGYKLGIVANFGDVSLETARVCNSNNLLHS